LPTAFGNRGSAYQFLGEHQLAINDFDKAIQLDPDFGNAYSNRGAAFASQGQHQRAIENYDKAI